MFHNLKVQKITRETASAVSVELEVPAHLTSAFEFKSGQFLTFKKDINGEEVRRCYSLCSTPKSGTFKVAIKKVQNGKFSSYAVDQLQEGEVIEVGVPAGKFLLNAKENVAATYFFIAGGSGVTPVLSMIKTALQDDDSSKVVFWYGNQSVSETIFLDEILELKQQYGERFSLNLCFSNGSASDLSGKIEDGQVNVSEGFITKEAIDQAIGGSSSLISSYYICGPTVMMNLAKEAITELDPQAQEKLNIEQFTSADADSSADQSSEVVEEDFDTALVTVNLDEVDYTFEVPAGQTILASGLKAGHDIPFSCQGGVCGSCECTVEEGKVELNQNMILSDEEIADGQTLACQAVPKTKKVKLMFEY